MGLINNIKCSVTYSRVKANTSHVIDKQKEKIKDNIKYNMENPGKAVTKVVANIAINSVIPGGTIAKTVVNKASKKVVKSVVEKNRVKSV